MSKRSILVVDDDALVNEFFSAVLTKLGHDVQTASSGEAALPLLQNIDFDVIMSDVKMPGMSGIELLGMIKRDSPDAVVMMITAHGTIKDASRR